MINYLPNNQDYIKTTEPNIIKQTNQYEIQNANNFIKSTNQIYFSDKSKKSNFSQNNRYNINHDNDIFDMRIYYSLKKLGLIYLLNIFETNNITFNEFLILSLKDLANLGIPKNQQIIIKKFSLDYIKSASYYSLDELQDYFINLRDEPPNFAHIKSFDNLKRKSQNNKQYIKNPYQTRSNNIDNYNKTHKRYNSFSNRKDYNNLINKKNNIKNNNEYYKRSNSAHVYNNNNKFNIINNNQIYNSINYDNNKRQKLKDNFINKNKKSNRNSLTSISNNTFKNNNNCHWYYTPSYYNKNISNYELINSMEDLNEDNISFRTNNRREIKNNNHNFNSYQNTKVKKLNEFEKRKINNILTNRIFSVKKRPINQNQNLQYNINKNNINDYNFINEKQLNMLLQMQKINKNNTILNNNIYNKRINNNNKITNTKINNYINNINNINKNNNNHGYVDYNDMNNISNINNIDKNKQLIKLLIYGEIIKKMIEIFF